MSSPCLLSDFSQFLPLFYFIFLPPLFSVPALRFSSVFRWGFLFVLLKTGCAAPRENVIKSFPAGVEQQLLISEMKRNKLI